MKVKLTSAQKVKLSSSTDVYKIMREVLLRERSYDRGKEHFWIVCLANNNQLLLIELVSFGSSTATIVEPTEVFSFALQKKAKKLIMVHNHPSGELEPSRNDKDVTERMVAIGEFVGIPVIDHLIISEKKYFSFTNSGLLKEIIAKSHYDLTFSQITRLKEQMLAAEKKAGDETEQRKKADKIVRKTVLALKKRKLSIAEIAAITGLTKEEIAKIK